MNANGRQFKADTKKKSQTEKRRWPRKELVRRFEDAELGVVEMRSATEMEIWGGERSKAAGGGLRERVRAFAALG
jgi:hypothetical protein